MNPKPKSKSAYRVSGTLHGLVRQLDALKKSMIADCAYQGAPGKKWLKENAPYYAGWNAAIEGAKQTVLANKEVSIER